MENLDYIKGVIRRFEAQVNAIKKAETSNQISEAERELVPIMKDLQLAIPRLGNDITKLTRERRLEIR